MKKLLFDPMFQLLGFSFVILICYSCKKEEIANHHPIVGQWEWFKTRQGRPDTTYTPESTGNTAYFDFDPIDSARYYVNDTLYRTYAYRFDWEHEAVLDTSMDSVQVLVIGNDWNYFFIFNDTLILDDTHSDGGTSYFTRK